MRRGLRLAAVATWSLALAVAPAVPWTLASEPATVDAVGWWNKTQQLPVQGDPTGLGLTVPTVPAPATVPEDGLYVANDASGPAAIAAVRYRVGGQVGGVLTLHLADGSALTGAEEIVACPVLGGFDPVLNGRWDARPGYEEEACIFVAEPTAEGDGLTFTLPATAASPFGDLGVVVVPLPGSATPFSLAFDAPADGDLVVTGAPTAPAPSPGSAMSGADSSPSYSAPPSGSPGFAAPATPSAPAPVPVESTSGEVAAPPASLDLTPAADLPDGSRMPQIVAAGLLAAIGAALWWLGGQPERAPRLLGSVGGRAATAEFAVAAVERPVRGVGRFARPRTAPATRI